jgi:hypothetical protein
VEVEVEDREEAKKMGEKTVRRRREDGKRTGAETPSPQATSSEIKYRHQLEYMYSLQLNPH